MSEDKKIDGKTCGNPLCFNCHLNNAVAAFVGSSDPSVPVPDQQIEAMLEAVATLAGALLAGAEKEVGHQFIGKVMIEQRRAEIDMRQMAQGLELTEALMTAFGLRPKHARN